MIPDKAVFPQECLTNKAIKGRRQVGEEREWRAERKKGGRDVKKEYTAVSVPQSCWMHRSWLF